jgi:hypothetical protein
MAPPREWPDTTSLKPGFILLAEAKAVSIALRASVYAGKKPGLTLQAVPQLKPRTVGAMRVPAAAASTARLRVLSEPLNARTVKLFAVSMAINPLVSRITVLFEKSATIRLLQ